MIETIIKRDGTRQPYDASKLNKWVIWAARNIRERVDWSMIVMKTVGSMGKEVESSALNQELIRNLIRAKRWPEQIMAGGLYASDSRKEIFGGVMPTVRKLHQNLSNIGLMAKLDYSDEDYMHVEKIIDHSRDFNMAYFQVKQLRKKYAIRNEVTGVEYETPQYTFMRMAMALSENTVKEKRLASVESFYNCFSSMYVNAPTPNYINLGTLMNGLASCCVYAVRDDIPSLAAGDHIGYMMTAVSAGIGNLVSTRSIGDPIRSGKIMHQGKLPYYKAQAGAVTANKQAGRAGADTTYVSVYDPEIEVVMMLQNPRSPVDRRNRDIHFSIEHNKLIAKKAALNEDVFLFNCFTAPDLYEAQFSGDSDAFEKLYQKYEEDPDFKKTYVSARDLIVKYRRQRDEVATLYGVQIDEMNRHTPHKDKIRSANLCIETAFPTHPYASITQLYEEKDHSKKIFKSSSSEELVFEGEKFYNVLGRGMVRGCYLNENDSVINYKGKGESISTTLNEFVKYEQNPEVGLCSLAGLVISAIDVPGMTKEEVDERYAEAAYVALRMIDECIYKSEIPLPHVKWTSLQRMNAGVGVLGLAYHMARKGLKYGTPEGWAEIDRVFERHAYFCIKASLRISKERGLAPWMHRTKWPEGWLPIDTYKKTVDELVPFELRYPWETLRSEIIENGGIGHSSLMNLMPTESSSKASGAPNGPYMVRDLTLKKSDSSNMLDWCAPDNDILEDQYQLAWSTTVVSQLKDYAVMQKWIDQGISADTYRDRTETIVNEQGETVPKPVSDETHIEEHLTAVKYGVKGEYYNNSFTGGKSSDEKETKKTPVVDEVVMEIAQPGCDGGFCTL